MIGNVESESYRGFIDEFIDELNEFGDEYIDVFRELSDDLSFEGDQWGKPDYTRLNREGGSISLRNVAKILGFKEHGSIIQLRFIGLRPLEFVYSLDMRISNIQKRTNGKFSRTSDSFRIELSQMSQWKRLAYHIYKIFRLKGVDISAFKLFSFLKTSRTLGRFYSKEGPINNIGSLINRLVLIYLLEPAEVKYLQINSRELSLIKQDCYVSFLNYAKEAKLIKSYRGEDLFKVLVEVLIIINKKRGGRQVITSVEDLYSINDLGEELTPTQKFKDYESRKQNVRRFLSTKFRRDSFLSKIHLSDLDRICSHLKITLLIDAFKDKYHSVETAREHSHNEHFIVSENYGDLLSSMINLRDFISFIDSRGGIPPQDIFLNYPKNRLKISSINYIFNSLIKGKRKRLLRDIIPYLFFISDSNLKKESKFSFLGAIIDKCKDYHYEYIDFINPQTGQPYKHKSAGHDSVMLKLLLDIRGMIAAEIPVWIRSINNLMIGRMDGLLINEGCLYVLDYKPELKHSINKAITLSFFYALPQVSIYGKLLRELYGVRNVKCIIFNKNGAWVFDPFVILRMFSNILKSYSISIPWEPFFPKEVLNFILNMFISD